jgi:hypothetical protein
LELRQENSDNAPQYKNDFESLTFRRSHSNDAPCGLFTRYDPAFSSFNSGAGSFQVSGLFAGNEFARTIKPVDLRPLQTKLIQKHPAVIQELTCWPSGSSDYSHEADSVWQIFFSFYNGELFRILVTYDQGATHGLTAEDKRFLREPQRADRPARFAL